MIDELLLHRSIRKYKDIPVHENKLDNILKAGIRASTTGNMQVYSIIVSKDPEIKQKLWEIHFKQDMVLQAPVMLTFCADFNRFNKWCRFNNAKPGYDNYLSFFTAAIDALLVAQNVCIAAEYYGLGICYLGTATYNADKLIDLFELPKGVVPVTSVVLGYPDEEPHLPDRLPLEAVVHHEKYVDYTKEAINQLYKEKESLEENINFIKENNLETLAQVFTEKRYTQSDNEFFSKKYLSVIEKQGFLLNF
jgi:nitroreductase